MRKWKKTSWVGRFALNFFRFPSKFYPHCFSLFVATIRARGSPRPLAHVTSGYLPVCRISVSICSAVFFQSFQICVGNFAFTVVLLLLGSKGNQQIPVLDVANQTILLPFAWTLRYLSWRGISPSVGALKLFLQPGGLPIFEREELWRPNLELQYLVVSGLSTLCCLLNRFTAILLFSEEY